LGVSQDAQTLDQQNRAKRKTSLPAEFGGLNVSSLELDAEHARYASFSTTPANLIIDDESESLELMDGLIRQELLNFTTFTLPWAVQLRWSYDTISTMCGFLESDLMVLTSTLNQDLSVYAGPDVELVVSPVNNAVAPVTQLTSLQLPTPDAFTRSGDCGGHIQWGNPRIECGGAHLDVLAFCKPSPPDYMKVISGTVRGAFAIFFAAHESSFKVPSECYPMAAHRVLGLIAERASYVRKCPRCNEAPSKSRVVCGFSSTVSGTYMSCERSTYALLMDHIPRFPCSW
jgi:hypothetical protein